MLTRDEYHKHDDQSILTEELALNTELKDIIDSLVEEVKLLRKSVHSDKQELQKVVTIQQKDISKLEDSLAAS